MKILNLIETKSERFFPVILRYMLRRTLPPYAYISIQLKKKKRIRHSAEFKAKILTYLEKSTQADLARLYKLIGDLLESRPILKTKRKL